MAGTKHHWYNKAHHYMKPDEGAEEVWEQALEQREPGMNEGDAVCHPRISGRLAGMSRRKLHDMLRPLWWSRHVVRIGV